MTEWCIQSVVTIRSQYLPHKIRHRIINEWFLPKRKQVFTTKNIGPIQLINCTCSTWAFLAHIGANLVVWVILSMWRYCQDASPKARITSDCRAPHTAVSSRAIQMVDLSPIARTYSACVAAIWKPKASSNRRVMSGMPAVVRWRQRQPHDCHGRPPLRRPRHHLRLLGSSSKVQPHLERWGEEKKHKAKGAAP